MGSQTTPPVAHVGPGRVLKPATQKNMKYVERTAGAHTYHLLFLTADAAPEVKVDGERLLIGGQTLTCDGTRLVLGKMAGPLKVGQ